VFTRHVLLITQIITFSQCGRFATRGWPDVLRFSSVTGTHVRRNSLRFKARVAGGLIVFSVLTALSFKLFLSGRLDYAANFVQMAGMVEAERRAGMSQRGRDHLVPLGDGVGDDRSRKRMPHPRLEETMVDHYRWRAISPHTPLNLLMPRKRRT
jgi:hypothetical protein